MKKFIIVAVSVIVAMIFSIGCDKVENATAVEPTAEPVIAEPAAEATPEVEQVELTVDVTPAG